MRKFVLLALVSILLVTLLSGCDGKKTSTSRPPIIVSVVTATPGFVGPQPESSASPGEPQTQPSPGATP